MSSFSKVSFDFLPLNCVESSRGEYKLLPQLLVAPSYVGRQNSVYMVFVH